jgi:hypothetical protein
MGTYIQKQFVVDHTIFDELCDARPFNEFCGIRVPNSLFHRDIGGYSFVFDSDGYLIGVIARCG